MKTGTDLLRMACVAGLPMVNPLEAQGKDPEDKNKLAYFCLSRIFSLPFEEVHDSSSEFSVPLASLRGSEGERV